MDGATSTCKSGQAVVSLFFNISCFEECYNPGNFFDFVDWQDGDDPKMIDFSELLPATAALDTTLVGYPGSFSVPPCDGDLCWYVNLKHYQLTGTVYQYF